jgi:hypothetical protein
MEMAVQKVDRTCLTAVVLHLVKAVEDCLTAVALRQHVARLIPVTRMVRILILMTMSLRVVSQWMVFRGQWGLAAKMKAKRMKVLELRFGGRRALGVLM